MNDKHHIYLICGSRYWTNYDLAQRFIEENIKLGSKIIHGDQVGADRIGAQCAAARGLDTLPVPADWNMHEEMAGPIRNQLMLSYLLEFRSAGHPISCLAMHIDPFLGSGTRNMVKACAKKKVRTTICLDPLPELTRMSGREECISCQRPLWKHPETWPNNDVLLCDGTIAHL